MEHVSLAVPFEPSVALRSVPRHSHFPFIRLAASVGFVAGTAVGAVQCGAGQSNQAWSTISLAIIAVWGIFGTLMLISASVVLELLGWLAHRDQPMKPSVQWGCFAVAGTIAGALFFYVYMKTSPIERLAAAGGGYVGQDGRPILVWGDALFFVPWIVAGAVVGLLTKAGWMMVTRSNRRGEKNAITDLERLQEFFRYCTRLEEQPFFAAYSRGGTFTLEGSFPAEGADDAKVSFDQTHLEGLLGLLRQFLTDGEVFYFKDIRRAIIAQFGASKDFESFYSKFVEVLRRRFSPQSATFLKANGKPVVEGCTFKELLEAQLYTGPLHSERILRPTPGSAEEGLADAHVATKKKLVLDLGYSSMNTVVNVLTFRNWALRLARQKGRADLFPDLKAFDERCRAAGV